mmetsp:Transcript_17582/g.27587  ORF Transcript_17582/g.27587 Transcript_17582/m.27587 type:complete len:286 (-) Transcript_17582:71-928(-)|eukprot:CAMPEP_0202687254 /NCGR_PEP_ID=MMETSP1385-20130828/2947_1 /ASSEMBLY_ACC=CAM_ASM_000861 /TAXON_ID=933848 /ORGANISM="Elphidium margaritaceum" /LENGTH=285 /DNA_ID=CAMNT_0049342011 /DNA_START=104 /DNA_END=961 /DNA_ORIENTATION=+
MVNLRLQKRLASSILKCGRHKIWLDPNEMNEVGMANTRASVRKLVRDGFIIKKPQKIHSRFRARQRAIEKKKGRHLGHGSRKGTRNARNPVKLLWMKRQRAMRRLLVRYKDASKIDRKMYHRYYLKAKGNSYKNKAQLIERIHQELDEKKRNRTLLEQYKLRRKAATDRDLELKLKRQKALEEKLKLVEEAEQLRLQAERAKKQAAAEAGDKPKRKRTRGKKGGADKGADGGSAEPAKPAKAAKSGKAAKKAAGKAGKQAKPEPAPAAEAGDGGKKKRKRGNRNR